jgi:serine protease AprX
VVYGEDFTGEGITRDLYGHGTHVAGILGGSGANSGGKYRGVAPGVSIVNLRALDETGSGDDSMVIAAIDRAIDLKSTYNIRVINLSMGRPIYENFYDDPLCQAVEAATTTA